MDKSILRKQMITKRESLAKDFVEKSGINILQTLIKEEILTEGKTIFTYVNMNNEIPTKAIIDYCLANKIKVCVPRVEKNKDKRTMKTYIIKNLQTNLEKGHFGVMEPKYEGKEATEKEVYIEDVDIVFLPGLAFDINGNRIGYGAGYYDTYLAGDKVNKLLKIALCYDFQIVERIVPDEHDIPVDYILTEKRFIKCHR